ADWLQPEVIDIQRILGSSLGIDQLDPDPAETRIVDNLHQGPGLDLYFVAVVVVAGEFGHQGSPHARFPVHRAALAHPLLPRELPDGWRRSTPGSALRCWTTWAISCARRRCPSPVFGRYS